MKILVVDDDSSLNRMLSTFLEKQGYEVHSAGDALQALDVAERIGDIGLVITDLQMPHLDGIALAEMLRADPRRRNLPVIVITAFPDESSSERSLRKGVALFLPKPVEFDKLLALVRFAE